MSAAGRRLVVGSDLRHPVPDALAERLEAQGATITRVGAVGGADTPWPDVAETVGRLVADGQADSGIVFCWTGTGVSIAANKVDGVRAALCGDAETARGARRWNDANVLALSLRATSAALADEIVDAWLLTDDVDPGERPNIQRVSALERRTAQQES